MNSPRCFVIIPAAGSGSRMHAKLPKQYLPVHGKPLLAYTLAHLAKADFFEKMVLVITEHDTRAALFSHEHPHIMLVTGGERRVDSVRAGLAALADEASEEDWIFVHDAARPLITLTDLTALHDALQHEAVGAILATPVRDTLKKCDAAGFITETVDRTSLWAAQTPQAFRYGILKRALAQQHAAFTDEASAVECLGLPVRIVEGSSLNIKVTFSDDLRLVAWLLQKESV